MAISETGLVINSMTNELFSLNPIGLEILKMMMNNELDDEIKKKIMEEYDITGFEFEKDFQDFLKTLSDNRIIEIFN